MEANKRNKTCEKCNGTGYLNLRHGFVEVCNCGNRGKLDRFQILHRKIDELERRIEALEQVDK